MFEKEKNSGNQQLFLLPHFSFVIEKTETFKEHMICWLQILWIWDEPKILSFGMVLNDFLWWLIALLIAWFDD